MEHHASSLSSLIWHWLLIPLGEPPVTFVTAFPEGRSNHRKEVSVFGLEVVYQSRYFAASVGGVEGLVLLGG